MTFHLAEFLSTLTPAAFLEALVLGLIFGAVIYGRRVWSLVHVYWMEMAGIVFFIPLALDQAAEGQSLWEHRLASLVLWTVFVGGTAVTPVVRRLARRLQR